MATFLSRLFPDWKMTLPKCLSCSCCGKGFLQAYPFKLPGVSCMLRDCRTPRVPWHWPLMKMERESVASEPGWLNQMAKTNKQETQWLEEEKRPPPPTWSRRQHMSIQVTTKVCLPPKFPCTFHILTKYRLILLATLMHHQAEWVKATSPHIRLLHLGRVRFCAGIL